MSTSDERIHQLLAQIRAWIIKQDPKAATDEELLLDKFGDLIRSHSFKIPGASAEEDVPPEDMSE